MNLSQISCRLSFGLLKDDTAAQPCIFFPPIEDSTPYKVSGQTGPSKPSVLALSAISQTPKNRVEPFSSADHASLYPEDATFQTPNTSCADRTTRRCTNNSMAEMCPLNRLSLLQQDNANVQMVFPSISKMPTLENGPDAFQHGYLHMSANNTTMLEVGVPLSSKEEQNSNFEKESFMRKNFTNFEKSEPFNMKESVTNFEKKKNFNTKENFTNFEKREPFNTKENVINFEKKKTFNAKENFTNFEKRNPLNVKENFTNFKKKTFNTKKNFTNFEREGGLCCNSDIAPDHSLKTPSSDTHSTNHVGIHDRPTSPVLRSTNTNSLLSSNTRHHDARTKMSAPNSSVSDAKWEAMLRRREQRLQPSCLKRTNASLTLSSTHPSLPSNAKQSSKKTPRAMSTSCHDLRVPAANLAKTQSCTKFQVKTHCAKFPSHTSSKSVTLPNPILSPQLENQLLYAQLLQWRFVNGTLTDCFAAKRQSAEHTLSAVWHKTRLLHAQRCKDAAELQCKKSLRLQRDLDALKVSCMSPLVTLDAFFQNFLSMSLLLTKNMHLMPLVNVTPVSADELLGPLEQVTQLLSAMCEEYHQQEKWNLVADRMDALCNLFVEEAQELSQYCELLRQLKSKNTHIQSLLIYKMQLEQEENRSPLQSDESLPSFE